LLEELRALSQKFIELRYKNYQRYFIKTNALASRCSIILGDRGIGKTTTIIQYLMRHATDNILYIQSDHILLGNLTLYEIAEEFYKFGGEFIAFDEIHKYANWSQELKSVIDTFPNLKIIASGSSALEIHKGSHDLSRRAIVHTMDGMSFREYMEIKLDIELPVFKLDQLLTTHEKITAEIIKKIADKRILALFKDYLEHGYYPYHVEYSSLADFAITLEQNIHTTIEVDLAAVHPELTGYSIKKIKQLIAYIATAVPFIPSWEKIKGIIEVKDNRTLKSYFKYLEDAALIRTLRSATKKLSGIEQVEKIYLSNTNQLYAITNAPPNPGTVRETFFISMLQQQHSLELPKSGDFYIDDKYTIEVGGKNKDMAQLKWLKERENSYLALDNIEIGVANKIPLWLFGFIY